MMLLLLWLLPLVGVIIAIASVVVGGGGVSGRCVAVAAFSVFGRLLVLLWY